ncbi:hypothetical protein QCM80_40160 [Bradyrhizobium sp. SSUT112]|uniref:hypothetical protein n=1 Tax=Bradyrhizobium sp. SSUT112 TaxID=3040604 RepID=UPI00244CBE3D|nr:hypothetical protein [Bradyrhizobium sp. SSUT112]MDH2356786.1 hypothetical protein [Bradyrhizobium sp. SSUT112]
MLIRFSRFAGVVLDVQMLDVGAGKWRADLAHDGTEFSPRTDSDSLVASREPAETAMVTEPKPKAIRKTPRRAQREEVVDYIVEIDGWDWGYSFSLNAERRPIDPYHEFRHLQVRGRLLQPTGLKTDRVELSLLPSPELVTDQRKAFEPVALGTLDVRAGMICGNIGIPWDALTPMLQMLIAARFKIILMRGIRFRHRSAKLRSLRLETKLTEDDVPMAEEATG